MVKVVNLFVCVCCVCVFCEKRVYLDSNLCAESKIAEYGKTAKFSVQLTYFIRHTVNTIYYT
jgi:hypothetical protein